MKKNSIYKNGIKRLLDILLSFCGIILLSPLMVVVALLVWCKLGSPIIFRQERIGKEEKVFEMYKFRSMIDKRDRSGELLSDADRLTPFGTKLRTLSLDELPELFNILKGDMSVVGPRPLLVEFLPYYTIEERKRHSVRGGLTGLAQINGRNCLEWDERLKKDVEYVENISFKLDLSILLRTIKVVLNHENMSANSFEVESCLSDRGYNHNEAGGKESV